MMDTRNLIELLERAGIGPSEAAAILRNAGLDDLGFSVVDTERGNLQVLPEIIFGQGKTAEQTVAVAEKLHARTGLVIVSRVDQEAASSLRKSFPTGKLHALSRMFVAGAYSGPFRPRGAAVVVTAGTSDLPVAEEAVVVMKTMGAPVKLIADVGVAGIHRLTKVLPEILSASVCIACAGMDAALVSVLGGLFPGPVIALPVSTGYGVASGGFTALFSALASCSPGVSVVNIDNGVGAAAAALRVLRND